MTSWNFTEKAFPTEEPACSGIRPLDGDTAVPGRHQYSHLYLLSPVPRYRPAHHRFALPLSGIVVPTARPLRDAWAGIALAARTAEAKGAQLVVLRSGAATADPFPADLVPATGLPTVVVDVPEPAPSLWRARRTGSHVVDTLHRDTDLGFKRNVGLLLGVMCGWRTVLFLDDDLSMTPASWGAGGGSGAEGRPGILPHLDDLLTDLARQPDLQAAGYLQRDFDDNSVVCHVRRLLGHPQGSFVSGGALLVRVSPGLPFFPGTYSEDWLFLFQLMAQGAHSLPSSAVKWAGVVHQRPYDPFSALRARSEELGDLLAEGLLPLLGDPDPDLYHRARSAAYWEHVLRERQTMIIKLLGEVRARHSPPLTGRLADVDVALRAALSVCADEPGPWADRLAGYLSDYLADVGEWRELLGKVTPDGAGLAVPEALGAVGLRCSLVAPRVEGTGGRRLDDAMAG
jgi:hypothetical protein